MSEGIKPVFNKTATFKGTNQEYNDVVYKLAEQAGVAGVEGDWARMLIGTGISSDHVIKANAYLYPAPKKQP